MVASKVLQSHLVAGGGIGFANTAKISMGKNNPVIFAGDMQDGTQNLFVQELMRNAGGKVSHNSGQPPSDTQSSLPSHIQQTLWNKAIEFEGTFLAQFVSTMLETEDSEFSASAIGGMAETVFAQEVGVQIARTNGIGLAKGVYKELLKLQESGNGTGSVTRTA